MALCTVTLLYLTSQLGLYRATVLIEHRDHHSADRWLQIAGRVWRPNANWYFLKSRVNRRLGRFDQVGPALLMAMKLGWDVNDLKWEQNLALLQSGRFDEADIRWDQLFNHAGSDGPEICKAYVQLAFSEFRISDARGVLRAWQADFPNDPEAFGMEAKLEEAYLNWQQAFDLHQEAMKKAPHRSELKNSVARCSSKLGKHQQTIELVESIPVEERTTESWELLMQSLIELNQPEDAKQVFETASTRFPDSLRLKRMHGAILLEDGQFEQVVAEIEPVIEVNPADTESIFIYGQALQASGRAEEAQRYLELAKTGSEEIARLGDLHGQLLEDNRNPALRFEIAMIYYQYKSHEEGIIWLKNLLQVFPDYQPAIDVIQNHSQNQVTN